VGANRLLGIEQLGDCELEGDTGDTGNTAVMVPHLLYQINNVKHTLPSLSNHGGLLGFVSLIGLRSKV